MTKGRGRFIVLEGIDGAGTTTQAQLLHAHLDEQGLESHLTNEPTSGPVGKLIREGLSGTLRDDNTGARVRFTEGAQALLFAADRVEHSVVIEAARDEGAHVVSDRYVHSSIAYQSTDSTIAPERVVEVNAGIAIPDVTFFLDVPVDVCLQRLAGRDDRPSIYEKKDLLEKIDANYRTTMALYEAHYGRVVVIDGTAAQDAVHTAIVSEARNLLAG